MDPACRYLYLRPMLGVDLLFISRLHSLNNTQGQLFFLAIHPRFTASGMGRTNCQLSGLRNHRLFSDRIEQPVQYYPHEASMQTAIYFLLVTVCPGMHYYT